MIDDIKLIAEIKNHPLLYDPGVPENRDMNAKESTWAFIAKSLGYSVRECKMRWKSLRERFARERKKIIMNNDEYASDDEPDKESKGGSWHLMKNMSFLWNFVIHRNMNRSRSMFLNQAHEDQSNPVASMSAPIWLLPNVGNNNILQALHSKSMTQGDESDDYGVIVQEKAKDPLCVDDDNSVCFDIDSSDSEKDSKVSKRVCEEESRSEMENPSVKKIRRDSTIQPTSPVVSVHNEVSKSDERLGRGTVVEVKPKDKTQTAFSPNTSERSSGTGNPTSCKQDTSSKHVPRSEKGVNTCTTMRQSEVSCKERSDDELFCLSIAASMQRLTAKQRALLKLRIQQVMYEVEFPE